ncbi:hypothetical protein [Methylobacterium sp. Leaf118]|uniref:hypothetical protein n=1 Tax=Methylobacterium sp. Leaf118 TaxID=2876562 RepID=UPI001E35EE89|nr:hypothetical protein [Methylobacterium sp. Leaf118]
MGWPLVFTNGKTFTEADTEGFNYTGTFPLIAEEMVNEAQTLIAAVGTARQLADVMKAGPVASVRRRGRALVGVVALDPMDVVLATPVLNSLFRPGFVPESGAFSRASTGTYFDAGGILRTGASGALRFASDRSTGENLGALIEEASTNFLLQSDTPATRTVSLAAGTYTLWVEGTGSAALSGGTASGTATAATPVTFTLASTTSVTVTVSGTLTRYQLETGSFRSTYIPTTTAAVTRAADAYQWTLPTDFWNPTEGTFYLDAVTAPGKAPVNSQFAFEFGDTTTNNRVSVLRQPTGALSVQVVIGGTVYQTSPPNSFIPDNTRFRLAFAVAAGGQLNVSLNGDFFTQLSVPGTALPLATVFRVGDRAGGARTWNGSILQIGYAQRRLPSTYLPLISAVPQTVY